MPKLYRRKYKRYNGGKRRYIARRMAKKAKRDRKMDTLRFKKTSVFPHRFFTKFKYTTSFNTTITAGNAAEQVFRLNSLYDPDLTSTGHQPYGFQQAKALYSRYLVYKCSWHMVVPQSADVAYITVVPINGTGTFSGTSIDVSVSGEKPGAVTKVLGYNSGGGNVSFKGSCYLPRLNGTSTAQYFTDDRFQAATVGANPSEAMELHIVLTGPANITIRPVITLTYHAVLLDWNLQTQS